MKSFRRGFMVRNKPREPFTRVLPHSELSVLISFLGFTFFRDLGRLTGASQNGKLVSTLTH